MPAGELTLLAHVAVEIRVAIELANGDGEPYRSVLGSHPVTPSVAWRIEAEVVLSVTHPADVVVHLRLSGKDHGIVIDQDPGAVYVSVQGTGELRMPLGPVTWAFRIQVSRVQLHVRVRVGLDVERGVQRDVANESRHIEREVEFSATEVVHY